MTEPAANDTLTAVDGLTVGHAQMNGRPTGCTVVLAEGGATAGVDVRGGGPGTRETDLLDPSATVKQAHAIVFAGGSAFGLAAADGVVRLLAERGIGFETPVARVPIVPAAILFDLAIGDKPEIRPDADCGRRAVVAASRRPVAEGNVGAGTGASVGKLAGMAQAMKGGIGSAAIRLDDGLVVAAMVAVNALGDIVDPATGNLVAGVRGPGGQDLADARRLLRSGSLLDQVQAGTNTTLAMVATNARLSQAQATKLAQMAQDGLARAIVPAHTPFDGDTVFAFATGKRSATVEAPLLLRLGALAAEVTSDAILRAVRAAEGLPGLPAARDLSASPATP